VEEGQDRSPAATHKPLTCTFPPRSAALSPLAALPSWPCRFDPGHPLQAFAQLSDLWVTPDGPKIRHDTPRVTFTLILVGRDCAAPAHA
jgi:hypothetical protein